MTAVKNQGSCGSCWAFSGVGSIESSYVIKGKGTYSFSEQQVVSCSTLDSGCGGGWPSNVFKYVMSNNGIYTTAAYPYTATNGACLTKTATKFKITTYKNYTGCAAIVAGLVYGPLSVAVDATNWSRYKSGLFSNCGTGINHAVLLVAIWTNGSVLIKNSWGTSWGANGYIMLKNYKNCGMCIYPASMAVV